MTSRMGAGAGHTLQVRRTFAAPPARVFEAWTTPSLLRRWYGLDETWETSVAEVDLRVGGRYRIVITPPGKAPITEQGEYLEVLAGERLVYTQETAGGPAAGTAVVVTVEFIARGEGCEVVVTETGYETAAVRDMHQAGWPRFLARLAELLP